MILGLLCFALVAGALTNEIISKTTDKTPYNINRIEASTRVAAVGDSHYAVEQVR